MTDRKITSRFLTIIVLTITGCIQQPPPPTPSVPISTLHPTYAQGFTIDTVEEGFILNIYNPWQGAQGISYRYLLYKTDTIPQISDVNERIGIPLSRTIALSTTHLAYIHALGKSNSIVGVSGGQYVYNPTIRGRISSGSIADVGFDQSLNHELIMSLQPSAVLGYSVDAGSTGYLQKFKEYDIPVLLIADYLEETPLGKAEWLKVFGLLLGESSLADSLFSHIASEYKAAQSTVSNVESKPTVFLNLPFKDIWYLPGGRSYMAHLIADAGGSYPLSSHSTNASKPLSIEAALEIGVNTDVWINTGMASSMAQILSECPQAAIIPAVESQQVYNNNKRSSPNGGNDFFESGAVNPHFILKDLISIFHPTLIEHDTYYYQQVGR